MKLSKTILIGLVMGLTGLTGFAQLSPGDLSDAHAHLEGISNCTKCHVLGEKVANEKCLDCHKELKVRVINRSGYHASADVVGKSCAECHSDHHGRKFEMIRFDKDLFNHTLTGYRLTGAHTKLDCSKCHKPDLISDTEIKNKKYTYLGLPGQCKSCHTDPHQNTLPGKCEECHSTEAFKPAAHFRHEKTDFPLRGKHQGVDCAQCHRIDFKQGKKFQQFAGIPFSSCSNCHDDAHRKKLGNACASCHSEESFSVFIGRNNFNHNRTDYPLKGQHRQVDCAKCHQMDAGSPEAVFQDYTNKSYANCSACHKDVHENKFGPDCKKCHSEDSFRSVQGLENFNHGLTSFNLEGKHVSVDCKKCHKGKLTDPLPHKNCTSCHADYHENQFTRDGVSPDCIECHLVDGFQGSTYTIDNHSKADFPLEGAHQATPCFVCHKKKEKWSFRNIGIKCNDCHQDVHLGFIDKKYYPDNACESCHVSDNWVKVQFDHALTAFELKGVHERINCRKCHESEEKIPKQPIRFSGLKTDCESCHKNVHHTQFEENGKTDCEKCHVFEHWKPDHFRHDQTRFPLDGAHEKVSCEKCHKRVSDNEITYIQYKMESIACISCHK